MTQQCGHTIVEVLVVIVVLVGGFGWVWNVVKIAQSDFVLTGLFLLRVVGIFLAPLGAIVGYL